MAQNPKKKNSEVEKFSQQQNNLKMLDWTRQKQFSQRCRLSFPKTASTFCSTSVNFLFKNRKK